MTDENLMQPSELDIKFAKWRAKQKRLKSRILMLENAFMLIYKFFGGGK